MKLMKSLHKAFDILEIFLTYPEEKIGLSKLAELSGLNKSTTRRIVLVLVERNYLLQTETRGKYSLSMKYLTYSWIVRQRIKLRDIAAPYLISLNQALGESVFLTVWDGSNASFIETLPSNHSLRITPEEGSNIPLYCSASGKIFLACNYSENDLEKYFQQADLKKYTLNTITDFQELKPHLASIAKKGFAFSDEERYLGVRSVAAAINDAEGKVSASVGIVAPSVRLTPQRMLEIVPLIKQCAADISVRLGFNSRLRIENSGTDN